MNNEDYLNQEWFAMPDDLIGGWCVMPSEVPPSQARWGEVGTFFSEEAAKHIANIHNTWLFYKQRRPQRFHTIV